MGTPPESELEIFSYEDFGVGIRWLAEQLVARDWIPDAILGVVRGGLFVSTALAYALDIKDVRHVNVEFYTALLLEALAFPPAAFTGVFAMGRVAGWLAHAREQLSGGRLIRPASVYVGPMPQKAA